MTYRYPHLVRLARRLVAIILRILLNCAVSAASVTSAASATTAASAIPTAPATLVAFVSWNLFSSPDPSLR